MSGDGKTSRVVSTRDNRRWRLGSGDLSDQRERKSTTFQAKSGWHFRKALKEKTTDYTFHLQPSPENYDSIIFGVAMLCRDGTFYWAEDADWSPESPERDETSWIAAKKLSWRDASEWMGPDLHYGRGNAEI
jgi:hypothetical protein